jgi:hypothetical protein
LDAASTASGIVELIKENQGNVLATGLDRNGMMKVGRA